jgi:uncharacterized protein YegL
MPSKSFNASKPRPLPVIILADTSGSMSVDGKIAALNQSLSDMLTGFKKADSLRAEIQIGLLTFGNEVRWHIPLSGVDKVQWNEELEAYGGTPLGKACDETKYFFEDNNFPDYCYRPILILLSDGHPTDEYQTAFEALVQSPRVQQSSRFALAIGNDADEKLLKAFGNDLEAPLFYAKNAPEIWRFFRAVTLSVTSHSKSQSPNEPLRLSLEESADDDLDLDFD